MNEEDMVKFAQASNYITMLAIKPENFEFCGQAGINLAKSLSDMISNRGNSNKYKYARTDLIINLRNLKSKYETGSIAQS